jgi:hypothetical protein
MSEATKTLTELRAEAAVALKNLARMTNKPVAGDDPVAAETAASEAIAAYNAESKRLTFVGLQAAEFPMLAAVKKLTFDVIDRKAETNDITKYIDLVIADKEKQIGLIEFDSFCEGKASADAEWVRLLKEFCLCALYKTCIDLGEKMKDVRARLEQTHTIKHIAKELLAGKTPLSQTQMIVRLQNLADAVIGGDVLKITKHDLEYVYTLMNSRGGCGNIRSPKPQTMAVLLMDVLHITTQKKSYTVSYQTRQKKGLEEVVEEIVANAEQVAAEELTENAA